MTRFSLLGPQRTDPHLNDVLSDLGVGGPLALVSAGWEERELEHEELAAHVEREVVNLRLFGRVEQIFDEDAELYAALRERYEVLRDLQRLYRHRLGHALEAARELFANSEDAAELIIPERADAIGAVADLDAHHLERVRAVHAEFDERWTPVERDSVRRHRDQIAQALEPCAALGLAGGHVLVLLNRLRLLDLVGLFGDRPIVAWAAGAMVLTDRIVLFHDSPPQGRGDPEVLEAGLGLAPDVVALPHARRRLRLDDPVRVALFARRFLPDRCLTLDERCRADWNGRRWTGQGETRVLESSGAVTPMTADAMAAS